MWSGDGGGIERAIDEDRVAKQTPDGLGPIVLGAGVLWMFGYYAVKLCQNAAVIIWHLGMGSGRCWLVDYGLDFHELIDEFLFMLDEGKVEPLVLDVRVVREARVDHGPLTGIRLGVFDLLKDVEVVCAQVDGHVARSRLRRIVGNERVR